MCLVAQLCPTLCNAMDSNPPGSSVHGDSPGLNTDVLYSRRAILLVDWDNLVVVVWWLSHVGLFATTPDFSTSGLSVHGIS